MTAIIKLYRKSGRKWNVIVSDVSTNLKRGPSCEEAAPLDKSCIRPWKYLYFALDDKCQGQNKWSMNKANMKY